MQVVIRNEKADDYRQVEELTREAFWNLHVPGCDEHYLVHIMRSHQDFLPQLDFVAVMDDKIVGNIMTTKSHLINENDFILNTITFGPISVLPDYQKRGIGSALINHLINKAAQEGYKAIVIEGHPHNYCKYGFIGAKSVNVSNSEGRFPYSLLVLEIEKNVLQNHKWTYRHSNVYNFNTKDANEFDKLFSQKEKGYTYTQEEFNIASNAYIE